MQIILAIADARGRNIAFVADNLSVYSSTEAIDLVKAGKIKGLYIAKRAGTPYLRSSPGHASSSLLDAVTIPVSKLLRSSTHTANLLALSALDTYWGLYTTQLKNTTVAGSTIMVIDGKDFTTEERVRTKLLKNKETIFSASKQYTIGPYLLGGILIDEIIRLAPFEDIIEKVLLTLINKDVSVGVGQVKLETARRLILNGYFNPNPKDEKLNIKNISKTPRSYLYEYVKDGKNNLYFSAAYIRSLIDSWSSVAKVTLTPELIATLYSLHREPHLNPVASERGLQIVADYVPMAREILDEP